MNKKNLITLTSSVAVLLLLIIYAAYAAVTAQTSIDDILVGAQTGTPYIFTATGGDKFNLLVSFDAMSENNAGSLVASAEDEITITLETDGVEDVCCYYDVMWEWAQTDVVKNQYTMSSGATNEFVLSGSIDGTPKFSSQLPNYDANSLSNSIYSGSICNKAGTSSSNLVYSLSANFYNQHVSQDHLKGAILNGKVKIDNVTCGKKSFVNTILANNTPYADNVASEFVSSSSGIDFSAAAGTTNGLGLYYTSTNTENNGTTYYFRGNVDNNYVKFGQNDNGSDLYWRIVRINEDGSVRLIYNGTDITGEDSIVSAASSNIGYMYSSSWVDTQEEIDSISNTTNSSVKTAVDNWYSANMTNYSSYLADAGFCNNREIKSTTPQYDPTILAITYDNTIQFNCPNDERDLFTLNKSNYGNKALNYPVGLLTASEAVYAGYVLGGTSYSSYLNNGYMYWTMSPNSINTNSMFVYAIGAGADNNGYSGSGGWSHSGLQSANTSPQLGIRPVINVKDDLSVTGTGTAEDPYVIGDQPKTLVETILADNTAYADNVSSPNVSASTGIDFSLAPGTSNGLGLYYTSTNTENNDPTYYFRGNVNNNYVQFGAETGCLYNGNIVTDKDGNKIQDESVCESSNICIAGNGNYIMGVTEDECNTLYSENYYNLASATLDAVCVYDGKPVYKAMQSSTMYYEGVTQEECTSNNLCVLSDRAYIYMDEDLCTGQTDWYGETWNGTYTTDRATYYDSSYLTDVGLSTQLPLYWRIVRINEDNSVRLLYHGTDIKTVGSIGENTYGVISEETYSDDYLPGYMVNTNIKTTIDTWYEANLKNNYSLHLVDAGFCDDRSGSKTNLGASSLNFACSQKADILTTATSTKGNQLLTYPIAMLNHDEALYAGSGSYLKGEYFWTLTPYSTGADVDYPEYHIDNMRFVNSSGATGYESNYARGYLSEYSIRPVINIKGNLSVTGSGTITNPYIVKVS